MSVLGVVASPHGGGSTLNAVCAVLDGASEGGSMTEVVDLVSSDLAVVVAKIDAADAVVFGSPVYRSSHTALLEQLLEHVQRGAANETSAPLHGKATCIVMTGATSAHFLGTEHLRSILASFFASQVLSPALYLDRGAFDEHNHLDEQSHELALLHGRALVELAQAVRTGKALGQLEPLV
jgi:FMN reductase